MLMVHYGRFEEFDKWCSTNSITRRGYDTNQLDGNNCRAFMKSVDKLKTAKLKGKDEPPEAENLLPPSPSCLLILDTLQALQSVVKGTMSHVLASSYKQDIGRYAELRAQLPPLVKSECGSGVTYSWKEHILIVHLESWLDDHQIGLASVSEQASESVHHFHEVRSWSHYKVPEGHSKFMQRVTASVVKFSSLNTGFTT